MDANQNPKPARPRQRWRGRPTDAVLDQRVGEAITVLSERPTIHRCQIHEMFCDRWDVHWKTVDRIVDRARKRMMERLGRSKEIFRCESLAFYEAMTKNPEATVAEKIHARKRIDDLMGLDAPRRAEMSGPDGGAIEVAQRCVILELPQFEGQSAEDDRAMEAARAELDLSAAKPGGGNGNGHHGNGNGNGEAHSA